jgi:hypothetical protein
MKNNYIQNLTLQSHHRMEFWSLSQTEEMT